uniref:Cyclin-like domain-containing protein n=1 Tax=Glossina pallidipes TaxID=7398 RepID=A0A1B0AE07_GLOPL
MDGKGNAQASRIDPFVVLSNEKCANGFSRKDFIMNTEQGFLSPTIPHVQFQHDGSFVNVFTQISSQERINKSDWISDYSEDIFETLLQTEMKRRIIHFRSQQCHFRPMLLKLIKDACDCYNLCRITLHLAVYLLDCFMDMHTVQVDRLNLTVLACLMIAAKIEEAEMDMPRFADLNSLVGDMYTLDEFKTIECKILASFNFDLIRPSAATFSEYFSYSFITLSDYQRQLQSELLSYKTIAGPTLGNKCPYSGYDDMQSTLNKKYFELIDISLDYLKFANVKPSIIASAGIAAIRKMHGVLPVWTMHLEGLTTYNYDAISPFVDAVMVVPALQFEKEYLQIPYSLMSFGQGPYSAIALASDLKSDTGNEEEGNDSNKEECSEDDKGKEEDEIEYPLMAKRRKLH